MRLRLSSSPDIGGAPGGFSQADGPAPFGVRGEILADEPATAGNFADDQLARVCALQGGWVAGVTSRHCRTYPAERSGPAMLLQELS